MTCYLLCFDRPVGDAAGRLGYACHYLGSTPRYRLAVRMREHQQGRGACLTAAAARAGIGFEMVRTWPGGRAEERRLKGRPKGSRELREKCPRCNMMPRIRQWAGGRCKITSYPRETIMEGMGYAATAALLAEKDETFTADRRQVYMWARRGTRNARGQPFPAGPPFSRDAVLRWWNGGRPTQAGGARRFLAERRDTVTGRARAG